MQTPTWRARLRLLPRPLRVLGLVFFLLALFPGALELYADLWDRQGATLAGSLARHPALVRALVGSAALGALLALERPRSISLPGYGRQLRARFGEVQADFDGTLCRREHEEEEKSHAAPLSATSDH